MELVQVRAHHSTLGRGLVVASTAIPSARSPARDHQAAQPTFVHQGQYQRAPESLQPPALGTLISTSWQFVGHTSWFDCRRISLGAWGVLFFDTSKPMHLPEHLWSARVPMGRETSGISTCWEETSLAARQWGPEGCVLEWLRSQPWMNLPAAKSHKPKGGAGSPIMQPVPHCAAEVASNPFSFQH